MADETQTGPSSLQETAWQDLPVRPAPRALPARQARTVPQVQLDRQERMERQVLKARPALQERQEQMAQMARRARQAQQEKPARQEQMARLVQQVRQGRKANPEKESASQDRPDLPAMSALQAHQDLLAKMVGTVPQEQLDRLVTLVQRAHKVT
jgi:hypothetical protein